MLPSHFGCDGFFLPAVSWSDDLGRICAEAVTPAAQVEFFDGDLIVPACVRLSALPLPQGDIVGYALVILHQNAEHVISPVYRDVPARALGNNDLAVTGEAGIEEQEIAVFCVSVRSARAFTVKNFR
jgi:hypothetical protein